MKLTKCFFLTCLLGMICLTPILVNAYETPPDFYRYLAKVNRVADGYTIVVDVDLGFGIWKHKEEIRLKGIKIPTMEEDAAKAVSAHKFLHETLKDQERILIQTFPDPTKQYDGWYALVSIWDEEKEAWVSVNQMVLDAGHGTAVE
jgi:endonuclease YncB( thermonuclease family)